LSHELNGCLLSLSFRRHFCFSCSNPCRSVERHNSCLRPSLLFFTAAVAVFHVFVPFCLSPPCTMHHLCESMQFYLYLYILALRDCQHRCSMHTVTHPRFVPLIIIFAEQETAESAPLTSATASAQTRLFQSIRNLFFLPHCHVVFSLLIVLSETCPKGMLVV